LPVVVVVVPTVVAVVDPVLFTRQQLISTETLEDNLQFRLELAVHE
jgi:hypothetical protein